MVNHQVYEATFATPEIVADSAWYPDSGATNRITNSSSSMAQSTPYNGSGKVLMGNDSFLPISVVGSSFYFNLH